MTEHGDLTPLGSMVVHDLRPIVPRGTMPVHVPRGTIPIPEPCGPCRICRQPIDFDEARWMSIAGSMTWDLHEKCWKLLPAIDWQETAIEVVTRMRAAAGRGQGITLTPGELASVTRYLHPL